jgi:hypothetical protein
MIPLNDTRAQYDSLKDELLRTVSAILARRRFILGKNVEEFAEYCGAKPTVGLEEGLRRTVEYYKRHGEHYW